MHPSISGRKQSYLHQAEITKTLHSLTCTKWAYNISILPAIRENVKWLLTKTTTGCERARKYVKHPVIFHAFVALLLKLLSSNPNKTSCCWPRIQNECYLAASETTAVHVLIAITNRSLIIAHRAGVFTLPIVRMLFIQAADHVTLLFWFTNLIPDFFLNLSTDFAIISISAMTFFFLRKEISKKVKQLVNFVLLSCTPSTSDQCHTVSDWQIRIPSFPCGTAASGLPRLPSQNFQTLF